VRKIVREDHSMAETSIETTEINSVIN